MNWVCSSINSPIFIKSWEASIVAWRTARHEWKRKIGAMSGHCCSSYRLVSVVKNWLKSDSSGTGEQWMCASDVWRSVGTVGAKITHVQKEKR